MSGLDLRRVVLLLGVAVLAPLGAASAQETRPPETQPRFEGPLAKKHSRYADLRRTADEAGDRSEQVLRDLVLNRTIDPLGDLDEQRKHLVSKKPPPRARLHAQLARSSDTKDDERQVFLARLPRKERRHAELRRFRDFAGDQKELARYRDDKIRFGNLNDKIGFAEDRPDQATESYFHERGDEIRRDAKLNAADEERRRDRRIDIDEERQLADRDRPDRDPERDEDRDLDDVDKDLDKDAEKAEKQDEKDAEKADRDVERTIDSDDVRSDRDTERQIQQEDEQNGPGND